MEIVKNSMQTAFLPTKVRQFDLERLMLHIYEIKPELHGHEHSTDLPNVCGQCLNTYLKPAECHRSSCPKTPSITTKMPMNFCTIYVL